MQEDELFVFLSWRKSTQEKKVKKQENQLEVGTTVSTAKTENIERLNEM